MLLCLAARERTAAQYSGLLAQAGDPHDACGAHRLHPSASSRPNPHDQRVGDHSLAVADAETVDVVDRSQRARRGYRDGPENPRSRRLHDLAPGDASTMESASKTSRLFLTGGLTPIPTVSLNWSHRTHCPPSPLTPSTCRDSRESLDPGGPRRTEHPA